MKLPILFPLSAFPFPIFFSGPVIRLTQGNLRADKTATGNPDPMPAGTLVRRRENADVKEHRLGEAPSPGIFSLERLASLPVNVQHLSRSVLEERGVSAGGRVIE